MASSLEGVAAAITGDLRIALALVGAVALLALVAWESWQRRRARRADDAHQAGAFGRPRGAVGASRDPLLEPAGDGFVEEVSEVRIVEAGAQRSGDEAALDLPEIGARDRLVDPPVVDLEAALRPADGGRALPVVDSVTLTDEPAPSAAPAAPRAEWPAEQERRIVGLRIVGRNGERFTGASVRQALQGEGFVHGEMQIFHRTTGDGRVLISAASLTRPGNFDLATMDSMFYRGLNLFAVLPGPLPPRDTTDKLLLAAHTIAQRLRADLQDSRGEPLTEARAAEMRREASASDA